MALTAQEKEKLITSGFSVDQADKVENMGLEALGYGSVSELISENKRLEAIAASSGAGGEKLFNQIQADTRTFDDEGNVTGFQESYGGPTTFTDIYNLKATNTSGPSGIKTVTTDDDGNLVYPKEIK